MYQVRLYKNSGFNAVNPPDSPALLDGGAIYYIDLPALDLLQNIGLGSVRVRATWSQVKDADYVKIYSDATDAVFYSIPADGIKMTSYDVVEIQLLTDYVLTAGGIAAVVPLILDGIVERCHVSDDTYGKWSAEDELLQNAEPLTLQTNMLSFSNSTLDVVGSTLDLGIMANVAGAVPYEDTEGDEPELISVPKSYEGKFPADYMLDGHQATNQRLMVFALTDTILKGISAARSIGITNAVNVSAAIPTALVSGTASTETVSAGASGTVQKTVTNGGLTYKVLGKWSDDHTAELVSSSFTTYTRLTGVWSTKDTGFAFIYDNTVKNRRVLYGGLNRAGFLTTAGNRLESKPEELVGNSRTTIHIKSVGDPHLDGCPYHRFEVMNGNSTTSGFWMNCVQGLPWKQIPLVFTSPVGTALNRVHFENSREVKDMAYGLSEAGINDFFAKGLYGGDGQLLSIAKGVMAPIYGLAAGRSLPTSVGGFAGASALGTADILGGAIEGGLSYARDKTMYDIARRQEMQGYAIQQGVGSPSVDFPYDGQAFRDFYGETVIAYRYRPTATDLARMDKVLTMYGYKTLVPPSELSVTNRQYFNYVKGNFTVGGTLPRWLSDGISTQLSGGMRFWHVKPSPQYYSNNPVVVPPTP